MIFRPEDFFDSDYLKGLSQMSTGQYTHALAIASTANNILNEYIATLPVVTGSGHGLWGEEPTGRDTKKAKLWDVQELPKKECEHEGILEDSMENVYPRYLIYRCRCGIRLKPKWEPA